MGVKLELSEPYLLTKDLRQPVELVPLSAFRVVCLWGEPQGGRAVVLQLAPSINLLGRYRFGAAWKTMPRL